MLGIDAERESLRTLVWAAEGQRLEAWDHTASINTVNANIHRDSDSRRRPYELHLFHPYREADTRRGSGIRICAENKEILKKLILARKKQQPTTKRLA